MSTFQTLIDDLSRDYIRAQPNDALQFCANWFQTRLQEQRSRTREALSRPGSFSDVPKDLYTDSSIRASFTPPSQRSSFRASLAPQSPFGTLNVPGNALLSDEGPPIFHIDGKELPPTSPLTTHPQPFQFTSRASFASPGSPGPGDYLHPPTSAIFARRTSVSAESILVDGTSNEPLPVFPKTQDQLRRIRDAIRSNIIFQNLDEEQENGALNAMREVRVQKSEVIIRQGDVGEYFYVVETGLFNCYIRPPPLPSDWGCDESSRKEPLLTPFSQFSGTQKDPAFGFHTEYGTKVAECPDGSSFGELALMYGHPRAASVIALEASTVWALDRMTFRTIILKAAHRRRTMYEQFLSAVPLLSSLGPAEKSKIADALVSKVYQDGEAVVRQGEQGDAFFFVEEGEATVTKLQETTDGQLKEVTVGHYQVGDYFGELSLLLLAPRAATVSAVFRDDPSKPKLKVAALDAQAFTRLLGPLRELMVRRAGENYLGGVLNA